MYIALHVTSDDFIAGYYLGIASAAVILVIFARVFAGRKSR